MRALAGGPIDAAMPAGASGAAQCLCCSSWHLHCSYATIDARTRGEWFDVVNRLRNGQF